MMMMKKMMMMVISSVNLAGILGGRTGGSRRGEMGGIWGGGTPSHWTSLENLFVFVHSGRYFVSVSSPEKNAEFPPEAVIWWTLKMYFWEIVNTVLESCGW